MVSLSVLVDELMYYALLIEYNRSTLLVRFNHLSSFWTHTHFSFFSVGSIGFWTRILYLSFHPHLTPPPIHQHCFTHICVHVPLVPPPIVCPPRRLTPNNCLVLDNCHRQTPIQSPVIVTAKQIRRNAAVPRPGNKQNLHFKGPFTLPRPQRLLFLFCEKYVPGRRKETRWNSNTRTTNVNYRLNILNVLDTNKKAEIIDRSYPKVI